MGIKNINALKNIDNSEFSLDESMFDRDCIYWGIFFEDEPVLKGSLAKEIQDKHVTFGFHSPFPRKLLGKYATVMIVGYANDGDNEAVKVAIQEDYDEYYTNNATPHITMSVSKTGKPVNSKNLSFSSKILDKLEELPTITGRFGYFDGDEVVI